MQEKLYVLFCLKNRGVLCYNIRKHHRRRKLWPKGGPGVGFQRGRGDPKKNGECPTRVCHAKKNNVLRSGPMLRKKKKIRRHEASSSNPEVGEPEVSPGGTEHPKHQPLDSEDDRRHIPNRRVEGRRKRGLVKVRSCQGSQLDVSGLEPSILPNVGSGGYGEKREKVVLQNGFPTGHHQEAA